MVRRQLFKPDDANHSFQEGGYINATLAASIAQAETLAMMGDRLSGVDRDQLHARVIKFMSKTRSGIEPTPVEIERAIGGQ